VCLCVCVWRKGKDWVGAWGPKKRWKLYKILRSSYVSFHTSFPSLHPGPQSFRMSTKWVFFSFLFASKWRWFCHAVKPRLLTWRKMSSVDRWRHKRPIAECLQWRNSVRYLAAYASWTIAAHARNGPQNHPSINWKTKWNAC